MIVAISAINAEFHSFLAETIFHKRKEHLRVLFFGPSVVLEIGRLI